MNIFKNKYLILTIIGFCLLYSLISILNHYYFRTYALDLGLYTNALYDYSHFQFNDSCVFKEINENILADHFDLYLIFFSPLIFIFKTYTLLILQIFFIIIGGIGIYKYFYFLKPDSNLPLLATICFYSFFGIFSAVSFDYHSNVIATMIVPWILYYFKQAKYKITFILIIFTIVSKENISLWIAFICLGLFFEYRKDKKAVKYLFIYFLISVIYFVMITGVAMPALSLNGKYPHFDYLFFGSNFIEVLTNIISHPIETVKILFVNHTNNPSGDYVKFELHILLLLSGTYMLLLRPYYLIMLIPIYFQKLFNDRYNIWGINAQYCVEFAPIIIIGIFSAINKINNVKLTKYISVLIFLGILGSTIRTMDAPLLSINKAQIRFYQLSHYSKPYNISQINKQLNQIPDDAIVSAQSPFLPHLALRDKIYQFPIIKDAEYIICSYKEDTYPLNKDDFKTITENLLLKKEWLIMFKNDDYLLLKKAMHY